VTVAARQRNGRTGTSCFRASDNAKRTSDNAKRTLEQAGMDYESPTERPPPKQRIPDRLRVDGRRGQRSRSTSRFRSRASFSKTNIAKPASTKIAMLINVHMTRAPWKSRGNGRRSGCRSGVDISGALSPSLNCRECAPMAGSQENGPSIHGNGRPTSR
jgi:hypothetical protein